MIDSSGIWIVLIIPIMLTIDFIAIFIYEGWWEPYQEKKQRKKEIEDEKKKMPIGFY
jgi:hypothetical protein